LFGAIQCFGFHTKLSKMILVHCCQLCNCRHCNYGVISTVWRLTTRIWVVPHR